MDTVVAVRYLEDQSNARSSSGSTVISAISRKKTLDLVSEFIARYRKEYDFYEQACRMVAQTLEANLRSAGVRAIVTSRAKNPARLEAKVKQRAIRKKYKDVSAIFDDIVDLAGVRVALYFPGERQEVGRIIQSLFELTDEPKEFPSPTASSQQSEYQKRFSGYLATHYRVVLKESSLQESNQRYAEAKIEIQVASVLMHAWSEVEHDLVYKPLQGELSIEEYAILDELNGLVLAGEIALERLQRAGELRASTQGREFSSHYDLAASLIDLAKATLGEAKVTESAMGRVDTLFELLKALGLNRPEALAQYVKPLHSDFERRPLSEQVIDQILAEDSGRYDMYEKIRRVESVSSLPSFKNNAYRQHEAIGEFIKLWVAYESRLGAVLKDLYPKESFPSNPARYIREFGKHYPDFPSTFASSAMRLHQFRNRLVHGVDVLPPEAIKAASEELRDLTRQLESLVTRP